MAERPLRREFLKFAPPWIGDEEIDEVVATLRSGWLTTGQRTHAFEESFASAVGAESALALNSGTAALHVALAALGVGPGDAVITTPMTFVSGVHVIEHVGARPLLADVDAETLNIDPRQVEKAIALARADGAHVAALMPVHLHGHPCEMTDLGELAVANDMHVVEDAAHALPASYRGVVIGAAPAITAFSFYATKTLTTGEGGMLTGPAELIERARPWSLHGIDRDAWKRYDGDGRSGYDVAVAGFKYNMSDLQAALGSRQLAKMGDAHARRSTVAARYAEAFAGEDLLQCPVERDNVEHAWHVYALRLCLDGLSVDRDGFIGELKARQIAASVHFAPVHVFSYYRDRYGYSPEDFPVAHAESSRLVSLPIHPLMTDRDTEDVVSAVIDVVTRYRR